MTISKIVVIDLGINNLSSLLNAIKRITDIKILVINKDDQINRNDLLVLPGNGNFGEAIKLLRKHNLDQNLKQHVSEGGRLLGICLGMQLLFSDSEEAPGIKGLELIKGRVKRIPPQWRARVPHTGWNTVYPIVSCEQNFFPSYAADFYFSHSFIVDPKEIQDIACVTKINPQNEFASCVKRENVIGVQFHPEKSSKSGAVFLNQVLDWSFSEI